MKSFQYHLLCTVSYLVALLPLRVLYLISDINYYVIYYIVRYRRDIVFSNLKNSFPGKTRKEITAIAKKYFHHLSDIVTETIKLVHIPEKEIRRRIKLRNPEILKERYSNNKLVLTALGHYNNWEWISTLTQLPEFQIVSAYKPIQNLDFDRFVLNLRSNRGSVLVPVNQTLRFLSGYNNPDQRAFFCFIADQSPLKKDIHYWTKFLNQDTPVFIGIEKIAIKMDLPVCYFRMHKIKRGYYELEIVPITDEPSKMKPFEITEAHVRLLEEDIFKKPEFWLWSHRRWKRKLEEPNKELN
jgi:Kdo2-lipid IVA lauroyltransferase/acyltransferase